jgi:hypothetical protein
MSLAQEAGKQGVLIIEGIHALNPHYTAKIGDAEKFRIYISPLTSIQVRESVTGKHAKEEVREASLGPGQHASLAAKPAQDARRTRVGGGGCHERGQVGQVGQVRQVRPAALTSPCLCLPTALSLPLLGQVDDANAVKSSDLRLCRRMCRDYLFRANHAAKVSLSPPPFSPAGLYLSIFSLSPSLLSLSPLPPAPPACTRQLLSQMLSVACGERRERERPR